MILSPSEYPCPQHEHVDLADLVMQRLEDGPSVVVGYSVAKPVRRERAKEKPFLVVVACPGDGAAHDVECSGTFSDA